MLSVDNHPLLKLASTTLYLLQNDRTEKVWLVFGLRVFQQPKSHALDVSPKRLPLLLLVPDIWPLKQWNQKSLWLTEYRVGGSDLSFHTYWLRRSLVEFKLRGANERMHRNQRR